MLVRQGDRCTRHSYSIVRLSRPFQACLFIFYENNSRAQKHVTSKNEPTKQE